MADTGTAYDGPAQPDARADGLGEAVDRFVRTRVIPSETVLDAGGKEAAAALARLRTEARAAGLWALPLPAELGGGGLTFRRYAALAEAEGASDHGPAALGSAPLLDVTMLERHGTARVREEYLERLVAGSMRTCYAMTEPDVPGTDPLRTATRAEARADGGWSVSGRKWFTSGAAGADLVTVLARTGGAAGDREGLSLLLVPTASPGFRVVRELPVLGAAGQYEIELDRVRVPADHLLGTGGDALAIAGERLALGRTLRCLRWLGQARRAFDLMAERAATRSGSRGPLAEHQLVQQHVFDSLLALRTTRPLVHEAVALIAAGRDARTEVGLAKVAAARMLQQVTDSAIQVHGAAGLGPDTALPSLFRGGRAARILDGPDELHITSVARRVLRGYGRGHGAATPG
ncbi:(R)-benzylsuccinyl-CoA dehydrogenase [Streptomyces lavendulae subsp. lavendulae]|uniref:(R)-benzylsuccinyl-CoA dehydrogenase n=1 Tax=Streptomyces lavendulae subsp. lavendulae TaxID=58340 RepID=A0A2K8PPK7_STRLA|nr:(R)-benzylsuccinyl-CoA dehydrogenase [Streptomyces lavendulae subsp. lavendulae]QUQ58486.1 (R)-benzylsuccinyl-CoA dehydrogenase [Streptomyces lavendulae subsp. lavendulae]